MEFGCFKKLETSVGLIWPAGACRPGQTRPQATLLLLAWQARLANQVSLQARPGQAGKKWPVISSGSYVI